MDGNTTNLSEVAQMKRARRWVGHRRARIPNFLKSKTTKLIGMNMQKIQEQELERGARKAQAAGSFIARNYWLWVVVAFVLYPLSAVFSAITEGGHILIRSRAMLGDGWIPVAVTIILVVMIESLKYFLGKGTVDDLQANPFSEGGASLAAFSVKALGFMAIMTFSVMLSVQGAGVMNDYFRKTVQPVTSEAGYQDEAAILARYDQELLPHRDNIRQYQTIKWKGTITVDARRMIRAEQQQIDKIIAARDIELARARDNNDEMKSTWAADTEENHSYAMGFAGLGEAICLFCLIFIGVYDDGIKKQVRKNGVVTAQASPAREEELVTLLRTLAAQQPSGTLASPTMQEQPERRRIGFTQPDKPAETQSPHILGESPVNQVATGGNLVQIEIQYLELAKKNLLAKRAAWAAKLREGAGLPATNTKRIEELDKQIDQVDQLIKQKAEA